MMKALSRTAVSLGILTLLVVGVPEARADTIYLKNGRVIRSSSVQVEGDRVTFRQYSGMVTIPMSIVDRIEQDPQSGPDATTEPAAEATIGTAITSDEAGAAGEEEAMAGEGEDVPPEQTREYWQERILANTTERQEIQGRIEELRREERAFLFSQRSTAETRRQIEEQQERLAALDQELRDIQEEARRLGIPPGWLRVQIGGDGGADDTRS